MNLNHVTIPSVDVLNSIQFYQKIGLKLIVHTHDAYARFECAQGDSTFSIHEVNILKEGFGVMVYFEVNDLEQIYDTLMQKGIRFQLSPTDQPWLWKEAHLVDPDGNKVILYEAGVNRINPPWRKK